MTSVVKEKNESSKRRGCLKYILVLTALCLFFLWWLFSISSEEVVDYSQSEQNTNGSIENSSEQLVSTCEDSVINIVNNIEDGHLYYPSSPTPITIKNRSIRDLLYFPYGCLPKEIDTQEKAQDALSSNFGSYEVINQFSIGLHRNNHFDYSYKDVLLGISCIDWSDNRNWYHFYLNSKAEADMFYNTLVEDIIKAGIPLTKDKAYGDYSNRKHPVSIFKWVFVSPPRQIKEGDVCCNLNKSEHVGKYLVELGVYKRKK